MNNSIIDLPIIVNMDVIENSNVFELDIVELSNVLNLSCFNNEDFIDKFPLSQFNTGIFSFKENET